MARALTSVARVCDLHVVGDCILVRAVSSSAAGAPRLPQRWFIRAFWSAHRAIFSMTRGRLGLWIPKPTRWGTLRLTTIGRRSGDERSAILGYFEDGPNLVTLAMNGWADGESRAVRGRAAVAEERTRLWTRWRDMGGKLDAYANLRPSETAVVVLEPRPSDARILR